MNYLNTHNDNCLLCPRIVDFLSNQTKKFPNYHNKPVPGIGPVPADFLIVGLAPGFHGGNATGKPFTGDHSGNLIFKILHEFKFSNIKEVKSNYQNINLTNCRITNAIKCVPPKNKPLLSEIKNCSTYLKNEIESTKPKLILCLGTIAHNAVFNVLKLNKKKFVHGKKHFFKDLCILDSYHPSRLNVNTGRINENMLNSIFKTVRMFLKET